MGMDFDSMSAIILQWLMWVVPSTLVYLTGAIIASYHLTRSPRPAKLALAGCGINLFCTGLSILPYALSQSGWLAFGMDSVYLYYGVNIVSTILSACGFGLVFAAVFVDRNRPEPPPEIE